MQKQTHTKQKSIILDYLKSHKNHSTASEIAAALKGSVSTATIYRQLESLVDSGIIRKYITDGCALYQYAGFNCDGHFHLKCTHCDTLYHVDCSFLSELSEHIFAHHSFTVDNRRTVMYGVCQNCLASISKEDI